MASGREARIAAQKRAQYQQKRQRNQIVGQLNQEYTAIKNANPNMTAEQIFAAQRGTQPYTVTDTDTLESIASANGVDPTNVLDQNPELKNIQTGMVINVPRPGSDAWRAQNVNQPGGLGLPSNAALGGTTTNPQGSNYFQSEKLTTTQDAFRAAYNFATPPGAPANFSAPKPTGQTWIQQAASMAGTGAQSGFAPTSYAGSIAATAQAVQQNSFAPATSTPQPPRPTVPRPPTGLPSTYPGGFRRWVGEEMAQINSPSYVPNEQTLKYLQQLGLIKKSTPQQAYGGGGYGYRRRGGGGGRRRTPAFRGGGGGGGQRLPAFGSGSGFNGLVNWRI
jgi:hypothetical protein